MYSEFFGLKTLPFKITPDLKFFYKYASREDVAEALIYSLSRGDGIIKVVGEVGSGKTTLLRLLASKLPNNIVKVYVSSPNLSPADFLQFICSELGIVFKESPSKLEIVKALQNILIEIHKNGKKVVLLIDESQSMTVDTLEEVRLLGNLETQTDKLIQIILFGQPEFDATLSDERLKSFKDRLASEISIPALTTDEVYIYLNYRMRIAGSMYGEVFGKKVSKKIQLVSKGLPRAINLLADKLLMAAFSQGDNQVKISHFKMLDNSTSRYSLFKKLEKYKIMLLVILLMVFILMIAFLLSNLGKVVIAPSSSKGVTEEYSNVDLNKISMHSDMSAIKLDSMHPSSKLIVFKKENVKRYQNKMELLEKILGFSLDDSNFLIKLSYDRSQDDYLYEAYYLDDLARLNQKLIKFQEKFPESLVEIKTVAEITNKDD
jgi:type II secretory pathway predicted ATPase ExeA